MAAFSEYAATQYRHIFEKHCETHHGKLSLTDLFYLMPQFGPELSAEQVKELMYRYDYSCSGKLDFEDFLELLGDYENMCEDERQQGRAAFRHFEKLAGTSGLRREELVRILTSGPDALSDEEVEQVVDQLYGRVGESISREAFDERPEALEHAWVRDPEPTGLVAEPLLRQLVVRVFHCTNAAGFVRTRVRAGRGVEFAALDPMVSVRCGEAVADTTVLIGHTRPEWGQELKLTLRLPKDALVAQRWLRSERIVFSLYDYQLGGVVPHLELLGSASIPLWSAFRDLATPVTHVLPLASPSALPAWAPQPQLEVSVRLGSASAAAPLPVELFELPEEVFLRRHAAKMRADLAAGLRVGPPPPGREGPEGPEGYWEYYRAFHAAVRARFRRRHIALVGLDEYGTFRSMPQFVTPIRSLGSAALIAWSPADIARHVARIAGPLSPGQLVAAGATQKAWGIEGPAGAAAAATPDPLQCSSPALVVFQQHGSPFEHAVLLCGLLLGRGLDAYVCLGHTLGEERHAWVLVLDDDPAAPRRQPATLAGDDAAGPSGALPFNGVGSAAYNADRAETMRQLLRRSQGRGARRAHEEEESAVKRRAMRLLGRKQGRRPARENIDEKLEAGRFYWNLVKARQRQAAGARQARPVHWDPNTGRAYREGADGGLPFLRVGCLFNHRNVWVNVQTSDLISRLSWELANGEAWQPYLTPAAAAKFGPVECWYSVPGQLQEGAREAEVTGPFGEGTRDLVADLVEGIRRYRKDALFIPNTPFHRPACRYLQSVVHRFEGGERGVVEEVEAHVRERVAPPHTLWHGRAMQFNTARVELVVRQLVWSGLLDCSVPGAAYAVGAQAFSYPWGLQSVWVYVGYLADLDRWS